MLTPVDLETTVFRRAFRGYQVREVKDFMNRLLVDYEHLYRENIELKEKIEANEAELSKYQRTEEMMRNALVLAEKTADEVKEAGQKQAELVVREAEQRADQVRARVKDEIRNDLERLAALRQQLEFFRSQFKRFLEGLVELADKDLDMEVAWDSVFKGMGHGGTGERPADTGSSPAGKGSNDAGRLLR